MREAVHKGRLRAKKISGPRQPLPGTRRPRYRCSLPGLTEFTVGRRGATDASRRRLSPRAAQTSTQCTPPETVFERIDVAMLHAFTPGGSYRRRQSAEAPPHAISEENPNVSTMPSFATVDPFAGHDADASRDGAQTSAPANGRCAPTTRDDIARPDDRRALPGRPVYHRVHDDYIAGLAGCPKHGLHNPLKNPHRYVMLGRRLRRGGRCWRQPAVEDYFVRLIQRVMPKSDVQCRGEVVVTRVFLENFAGDGVRFLARGFSNPGDHYGQESRGYRWPYGPVVVVAPFNFPLEIPALQVMGALFMGNRPLVKVDSKVSVVFEQFLRLLIDSGLPPEDVDLIHCRGRDMGRLHRGRPRTHSHAAVHRLERRRGTAGRER